MLKTLTNKSSKSPGEIMSSAAVLFTVHNVPPTF